LAGDTIQTVLDGNSGTEVIAVANAGYLFLMWSDSVTTPRRTDISVSSNIDVYAIFIDGTSVKNQYARGGNLPLVTVRAKTLNINTAPNSSVQVRVVNMAGRSVASFKSTGSASFSLRGIPAGAYVVEARRDGYRMTVPVVLR